MIKKHCQLCGGAFLEGKKQPWVCSQCSHEFYENPIATVDCAFFNSKRQVLITERAIEPQSGKYELPGGFLELDETLEECFVREVKEELGIDRSSYGKLVYVDSNLENWQIGKETKPLIIPVFATIINDFSVEANDEIASYKLVDIEDLELFEFSREQYPEIIRKSHTQLFG